MKQSLLFFILLCYASTFAQDASSEEIISELKVKIETTQEGEKLKWMDNLSRYSFHEVRKNEEAILKETIAFAATLDSVNIAIR